MARKEQMLKEIEASKATFVTYGGDTTPVKKEVALIDIASMDEDVIGPGDWEEVHTPSSMGRKGGSVKSERKTISSKENGKKGGRPKNI